MASGTPIYRVKRLSQGATSTNTINIYNEVAFAYGVDDDLDKVLPWHTQIDTETGHPLTLDANVDTETGNPPPWETAYHVPETATKPTFRVKQKVPPDADFVFKAKVQVPEPPVLPVWRSKSQTEHPSSGFEAKVVVPKPKKSPILEARAHTEEPMSFKAKVDIPEPPTLPRWESKVQAEPNRFSSLESKVQVEPNRFSSFETKVEIPQPEVEPVVKAKVQVEQPTFTSIEAKVRFIPQDPSFEDIEAAAMAEAMKEAARAGAPFCEKCTRALLRQQAQQTQQAKRRPRAAAVKDVKAAISAQPAKEAARALQQEAEPKSDPVLGDLEVAAMAQAMKEAARTGAPFCEKCERARLRAERERRANESRQPR